MEPAPFKDVKYVDPRSHLQVRSLRPKFTRGKHIPGSTRVLDAQGKPLWSAPIFVGRRTLHLSPDGRFLVLTGNYDFGSQLHLSGTEQVSEIFDHGKKIKEVQLSDLFEQDPLKMAEQRNLMVKGGNWVSYPEFIKAIEVDWTGWVLVFTLFDGSQKRVLFFGGGAS